MSDTVTVEADDDGLTGNEAILAEARERFAHLADVDKDNRDNQKADTLFVYSPGEQWPGDIKRQRTDRKEVCLEFNQLKQFVAQVVNDMRQNRPGIRVHAASGDASVESATLIQGMVRAIEYESKAEAVYDNGGQGGVVGGRGWWRVVSEYEGKTGLQQKLCIKAIADPMTVWADLDYQEPDGRDRNYVFVTESIPKKEFKRRYPKAEPINFEDVDEHWAVDDDKIYIADYYRRVCKTRTYLRMSDGAEGWKDEMPTPPAGVTESMSREVDTYSVEWFTIAGGQQVLETHEWPGSYIPVICCPGEDIMLAGKRVYQGLTRHARDAQSMLNFGMTQQAIHLALTPRAPWVAPARAIAGYENLYKDANNLNLSVLPYNDVDDQGVIAPPQRQLPSSPDIGWANWSGSMLGMIKSTIGMYENSLGQKSAEVSGIAQREKANQSNNATFNYLDNQARAIGLTGVILVECIPHYYDSHRIVQTVGIDDTRKAVAINQPGVDTINGALQAIKHNDVTTGDYAVTVEAGPSYRTKRQETSEALLAFTKAFPPAAAVAGDLIVKALDVPDADVLAERMQMTLPPAVQQAIKAKSEGKKIDPASMAEIAHLQQQLQQAMQTMEAMDKENKELKTGVAAKMQTAQIDQQTALQKSHDEAQAAIGKASEDSARDIQIEKIRQDTELEKARIQAQSTREKALMDNQVKLEIAELTSATTLQAQQVQAADAATDESNAEPMSGTERAATLKDLFTGLSTSMQEVLSQSAATAETHQAIMQHLADRDAAPKNIEYDDAGTPVRAGGRPIVYDEQGRVKGLA